MKELHEQLFAAAKAGTQDIYFVSPLKNHNVLAGTKDPGRETLPRWKSKQGKQLQLF
jgi:hypothetical protein